MRLLLIALLAAGTGLSGMTSSVSKWLESLHKPAKPATQQVKDAGGRLVMFIGVDISGSFKDGRYFDDSIHFLARYIYAHLNGYEGIEVPHSLFVGTIGGETKEDVKTLYPIQTFQDRSIEQIEAQLYEIFPRRRVNKYTDYNSFFQQVADLVDARKLILKPLSIVLLTDGVPDLGGATKTEKFRNLAQAARGSVATSRARALHGRHRQELARRCAQAHQVWTQDARDEGMERRAP
jgi:hypothetical protein